MGPVLASDSFTPPKESSPEGGKNQVTKAPRQYIGLDHGEELGAEPRHPDSAQEGGQQRKGSSDVAFEYCSFWGFCCLMFCIFIADVLFLLPITEARGSLGSGKASIWKLLGALKAPPHGWQVTLTSLWWKQG